MYPFVRLTPHKPLPTLPVLKSNPNRNCGADAVKIPTLRDVYAARATISPHFPRTPLTYSSALSDALDAEVYLKHEEHLPLGAFKSRGGINLLAGMSEEERARGVITASSGNHGQSIASACRMFGARAMIGLPVDANPNKVASMEALGAQLIFHGANFDEAREHCERLAQEEGYRYVHPVNEPALIAGVGTASLEIIEDLPDVEVMMPPHRRRQRSLGRLRRCRSNESRHSGRSGSIGSRSGCLSLLAAGTVGFRSHADLG